MIECLYCGGRYERQTSCPNCGAPNRAKPEPQPRVFGFWLPINRGAFDALAEDAPRLKAFLDQGALPPHALGGD